MVVGATMVPKIAPIINAALAASATPAPPGAVAQGLAATAATAAMVAGGPGNTVAPYVAAIAAALSGKTPNESSLFPSLGARAVKTG